MILFMAPKSHKVDFPHQAFGKTARIISYGYYPSIKNMNQKFQLTVLEKCILVRCNWEIATDYSFTCLSAIHVCCLSSVVVVVCCCSLSQTKIGISQPCAVRLG
jgi:hypothetical protein